MASVIKAIFKMDGAESEVISLSYSFDQNVDNIGQPAGEVRGGQLTVTLGSMGSEARFGWMVASDMKKSGEIDFVDATGQTLKTLAFEDAYCVGYTEEYDAFTSSDSSGTVSINEGAKETLVLSCRTISVGGETHENTWLEG